MQSDLRGVFKTLSLTGKWLEIGSEERFVLAFVLISAEMTFLSGNGRKIAEAA